MTPYEQLKKIIQQANPEIMELKFGCDIELPYAYDELGPATVVAETGICAKHKRATSCTEDCEIENGLIVLFGDEMEGFGTLNILKHEIKIILGRQIRLADVLFVIENTWTVATDQNKFNAEELRIIREWKLGSDNLDLQSEDLKNFLIKLLIKS